MKLLTTQHNCGTPLPRLMEVHALKPRLIIPMLPSVVAILLSRCDTEIGTAVVERSRWLYVVALPCVSMRQAENNAVHIKPHVLASNAATADRIETTDVWIPPSAPVPLRQPLEVSRINDSNLSLRKWDCAIGWLRGLGNLLFQAHVVPPQKALQLNPILT